MEFDESAITKHDSEVFLMENSSSIYPKREMDEGTSDFAGKQQSSSNSQILFVLTVDKSRTLNQAC
jgi:hypothetical protein